MRWALLGIVLLGSCSSTPRPDFPPPRNRLVELQWVFPEPPPALRTNETEDEAEIQFRAAFAFYRQEKWTFAAAAFGEALSYDDDRDDARYFLSLCLLLSGSDEAAREHLAELIGTDFDDRARTLLAKVYLRRGDWPKAREAALPAAAVNYDAAGLVARLDALTAAPE